MTVKAEIPKEYENDQVVVFCVTCALVLYHNEESNPLSLSVASDAAKGHREDVRNHYVFTREIEGVSK